MLKEYLSNLANRFREILGTTEPINAQDFEGEIENVFSKGHSTGLIIGRQEGYNSGYEQGKAEGVTEGIEQGKQAAYDEFWDSAELNPDNGTVTYNYTFAGKLWNDFTFKPKYNIVGVGNIEGTFMNSYITDLKAILERENKTMDFSGNNYISNLFRTSTVTHLPAIKFTNAVNLQHIFNGSKYLHTIDELNIGKNVTYIYQMFNNCSALENVDFKGVLKCNGMILTSSTKLSKASIESLINILSTSTSGLTVTLSSTSVKKAFETSSGANDGNTSDEWKNLIATKSNWTIALA